jgi:hypothetical protein
MLAFMFFCVFLAGFLSGVGFMLDANDDDFLGF